MQGRATGFRGFAVGEQTTGNEMTFEIDATVYELVEVETEDTVCKHCCTDFAGPMCLFLSNMNGSCCDPKNINTVWQKK